MIDPAEHGGAFMHMGAGHFGGDFIGPGASLAARGGECCHQRSNASNCLEYFHRVIPHPSRTSALASKIGL
jgi:hypothetical protein